MDETFRTTWPQPGSEAMEKQTGSFSVPVGSSPSRQELWEKLNGRILITPLPENIIIKSIKWCWTPFRCSHQVVSFPVLLCCAHRLTSYPHFHLTACMGCFGWFPFAAFRASLPYFLAGWSCSSRCDVNPNGFTSFANVNVSSNEQLII